MQNVYSLYVIKYSERTFKLIVEKIQWSASAKTPGVIKYSSSGCLHENIVLFV